MKKKTCSTCQYCRPTNWNIDIPGVGEWCSNSKSPKSMTRVLLAETCKVHSKKDAPSPWVLRTAIKILASRKAKNGKAN